MRATILCVILIAATRCIYVSPTRDRIVTDTAIALQSPPGRAIASGRQLLATSAVDDTAILSQQLAPGWSINFSGLFGLQSGSTQSPPECITFPKAGAWLSFQCNDCEELFSMPNCGGFQYNISTVSNGQPNTALPGFNAMQLFLQDSTGQATCNLTMGKQCTPNPDGTCTAVSRYLNAPSNLPESSMDCRPFLSSAVAVGFQSLQDNVSVCIQSLKRLPSTVVAQDVGPLSMPIPPLVNCWSFSALNTTLDGNYTNQNRALPAWMQQNITTSPSGQLYVAKVGIDMPFSYVMFAINNTCSLLKNKYSQAINKCAQGIWQNQCCVDTTAWEGPNLPATLADMCHSLVLPTSGLGLEQQCVGFAYSQPNKIAIFKSILPAVEQTIDLNLPGLHSACNAPNGTVFWEQADAVPGYEPLPGTISSSIYNSSLKAGWRIRSTSWALPLVQQSQPSGAGNSTGLCVNMSTQGSSQQAGVDGFWFTCQDCPSANNSFTLSQTAGFKLRLSAANPSANGTFTTNGSWPIQTVRLELLSPSQSTLCRLPLVNTGLTDAMSGMIWATALFQNSHQCLQMLNQTASIKFVTQIVNGQAFCLDDFQLLPSAVADPASSTEHEDALKIVPAAVNCNATSFIQSSAAAPPWYAWPQPIDQGGNFVLDSTSFTGVPQGSPNGFTLFNGLAFANPATLSFPATVDAGGNCSVISGTVTTPSSTVPQQACCYNVTQFKGFQTGDSWLPGALGQICNALWPSTPHLPSSGPWVCQGFSFDATTQLACFFGQQQQLKVPLDSTTCQRPSAAMWVLDAALPSSTTWDSRKQPSSGPKYNIDAGDVLGVISGIISPIVAFIIWMAITYSYRASKRRIVLEIVKRVKFEDISSRGSGSASSSRVDDVLTGGLASVTACGVDVPARNGGGLEVANEMFVNPAAATEAAAGRQALRQLSGLTTASSTTPLTLNIIASTHDDSMHEESMRQVRQAAASIAQHCLKHWDQFCGIRAQTDSTGIKAGIWRPRFESVRCAALLVAFGRTNEKMQAHPECPGTLMQAWEKCQTKRERKDIVQRIADNLQSISRPEAEALPDKDPEHV